jgi:glycine hydroxymethyltransferase
VANKNLIPFDPGKAGRPSGLRLGTPALTTRGMKEDEMRQIGSLIASLLHNPNDESLKQKARREVASLTSRFPLYPDL